MLLYYITDRNQFPGNSAERQRRLLATVRQCALAGVDMVQLREKDLGVKALESLAREAMAAVAGSGTKLLVNGRIDVAIAVGAHGVHLPTGPEQLPPSEVRVIFETAGVTGPLVGASCHTGAEVTYAEAHGADFAVFGPVFEKAGTPNRAGAAALATVCAREAGPNSRMPVLALGGISAPNADLVLAAGAAGLAGIRLFQEASDLLALVRHLRSLGVHAKAAPFRHPYQL